MPGAVCNAISKANECTASPVSRIKIVQSNKCTTEGGLVGLVGLLTSSLPYEEVFNRLIFGRMALKQTSGGRYVFHITNDAGILMIAGRQPYLNDTEVAFG